MAQPSPMSAKAKREASIPPFPGCSGVTNPPHTHTPEWCRRRPSRELGLPPPLGSSEMPYPSPSGWCQGRTGGESGHSPTPSSKEAPHPHTRRHCHHFQADNYPWTPAEEQNSDPPGGNEGPRGVSEAAWEAYTSTPVWQQRGRPTSYTLNP